MYEFGFSKKLIALTKMYMEIMKYRVRTQNVTSETFTVETGLKQGDTLSPVLFNLALEKVVRILQDNEGGLLIGQNKIRLFFEDDLDIIGDSLANTDNAARVLEEAAKKIGLKINTGKTMIMELIESDADPATVFIVSLSADSSRITIPTRRTPHLP
jgi:hypothetical protein